DFDFLWNFGDQSTSSLRSPYHSFQTAGIYPVRLTLRRKSPTGVSCRDQATAVYEINVLSDQPKTSLAADRFPLKSDDSGIWTYRLTRWALVLLTILATILFLGLGLLIRYLTYRPVDPKQTDRFRPGQEGPYTIPFPRQDHLIAPEKGLYDLASVMRQRRMGNIHTLNVPASIHSTIQEQGMPVLQYDTSSRPNEYLILIEQHHPESHLARFFGRITEILEGEDVLLDTFFYDGDPRNCWNDDFPEGISLEELKQRYRKHRLIFFTSGYHFVDPYTSELVPWFASTYDIWKENRLILTPNPVADWSYQEKLLMEEIDLLPLDIPAQMYMMEMFDEIGQPDFSEHKARLKDTFPGAMRGIKDHDLESIAGLKAYLGTELFRWVAATAVYPQPTWEVTLAIGHALSNTSRGKQQDYLLTFENLLTLARIPWLQTTLLPNRLREHLLHELDGASEKVARESILHLLEVAEVRPGSLASTKLAVQETSHEFFLHPGDEDIAARMFHLMQTDRLGDPVLKKRLQQESALLGGQSPATHLQHRFGFLRPQEYLIGGLVATLLVGLLTWFLYERYGETPWPSPRLTAQEQVANLWLDRYYEQDSASLLHNQGVAASQIGKYEEALELIQQARTRRADYPLADTNLSRLWYHQGAVAYNGKNFSEARRHFQQVDSSRERGIYLLNLGGQSLSHYYQGRDEGLETDPPISDSARMVFEQLVQLDEGIAFLEFPNLYRILKGEQNLSDSTTLLWNLTQTLRQQGRYAEALVMIDAVLGQAYQDSLTAKREGTEPPALAPLAIRARTGRWTRRV
ncbi:MAG: PKD domain-containing protein, partial [Bacteroidota bacterium]